MDNKRNDSYKVSNLEKAVILMCENELNRIRNENIRFEDMSMFQKSVILSDDEWINRLGIKKDFITREESIGFMRKYFGMDE